MKQVVTPSHTQLYVEIYQPDLAKDLRTRVTTVLSSTKCMMHILLYLLERYGGQMEVQDYLSLTGTDAGHYVSPTTGPLCHLFSDQPALDCGGTATNKSPHFNPSGISAGLQTH